jgi:hypothetical protein
MPRIAANIAGMAARQSRCLSAAIAEPPAYRDVLYWIIDGSHAVGQTRLPEVKATESSGDLGLPLRMPRTATVTTISPCCPDSSPIEKSWPLWPETVSAENADEVISTRLRAD